MQSVHATTRLERQLWRIQLSFIADAAKDRYPPLVSIDMNGLKQSRPTVVLNTAVRPISKFVYARSGQSGLVPEYDVRVVLKFHPFYPPNNPEKSPKAIRIA